MILELRPMLLMPTSAICAGRSTTMACPRGSPMCAGSAICCAPARPDVRYRWPSGQSLSCLQRQGLVGEHSLDDDVARFGGIDRVMGEQVGAVGDDLIGVLHHLQFLVAVVALQSHAL